MLSLSILVKLSSSFGLLEGSLLWHYWALCASDLNGHSCHDGLCLPPWNIRVPVRYNCCDQRQHLAQGPSQLLDACALFGAFLWQFAMEALLRCLAQSHCRNTVRSRGLQTAVPPM